MIKDALNLMMGGTEDEVIDFIDAARTKFKKMPPEDIAFPRTVSDVNKHKSSATIYGKGTPIHVRGALLYNHYVKEKHLDTKYSLINNGEKIKFLYLKKQIQSEKMLSHSSKISLWNWVLTSTLTMTYNLTKLFLEPVKVILDAIGWNVEKVVNLELFLDNGPTHQ